MANETPINPLLSNAWYNRIKFVAMVLLPAVGTLYFALALIWGLPKPKKIVGIRACACSDFFYLLRPRRESVSDS